MKSHYVPEFLTKPWETPNRKFKVFSFKTEKIYETNAKTFFTRNNPLSKETEEFWNKNVETPYADFVKNIEKYQINNSIKTKKWKQRKATVLFPLSIAERLGISEIEKSKIKISKWNNQEVDSLAWQISKKNSILVFESYLTSPFFFPEIGFFSIFLTENYFPYIIKGLAIPIRSNIVSVIFNKKIDINSVKRYATKRFFSSMIIQSVSGLCDKIVIHPKFYKLLKGDEKTIIKTIQQMRLLNKEFIASYKSYTNMVNKMHSPFELEFLRCYMSRFPKDIWNSPDSKSMNTTNKDKS